MASEPSTHFLATLYQFSPEAADEIIQTMHTSAKDVAVTCRYMQDQDMFVLQCPLAAADKHFETLTKAVESFIKSEIEEDEMNQLIDEPSTSRISRILESQLDGAYLVNDDTETDTMSLPSLATPIPESTGYSSTWIPTTGAAFKPFEVDMLEELGERLGCTLKLSADMLNCVEIVATDKAKVDNTTQCLRNLEPIQTITPVLYQDVVFDGGNHTKAVRLWDAKCAMLRRTLVPFHNTKLLSKLDSLYVLWLVEFDSRLEEWKEVRCEISVIQVSPATLKVLPLNAVIFADIGDDFLAPKKLPKPMEQGPPPQPYESSSDMSEPRGVQAWIETVEQTADPNIEPDKQPKEPEVPRTVGRARVPKTAMQDSVFVTSRPETPTSGALSALAEPGFDESVSQADTESLAGWDRKLMPAIADNACNDLISVIDGSVAGSSNNAEGTDAASAAASDFSDGFVDPAQVMPIVSKADGEMQIGIGITDPAAVAHDTKKREPRSDQLIDLDFLPEKRSVQADVRKNRQPNRATDFDDLLGLDMSSLASPSGDVGQELDTVETEADAGGKETAKPHEAVRISKSKKMKYVPLDSVQKTAPPQPAATPAVAGRAWAVVAGGKSAAPGLASVGQPSVLPALKSLPHNVSKPTPTGSGSQFSLSLKPTATMTNSSCGTANISTSTVSGRPYRPQTYEESRRHDSNKLKPVPATVKSGKLIDVGEPSYVQRPPSQLPLRNPHYENNFPALGTLTPPRAAAKARPAPSNSALPFGAGPKTMITSMTPGFIPSYLQLLTPTPAAPRTYFKQAGDLIAVREDNKPPEQPGSISSERKPVVRMPYVTPQVKAPAASQQQSGDAEGMLIDVSVEATTRSLPPVSTSASQYSSPPTPDRRNVRLPPSAEPAETGAGNVPQERLAPDDQYDVPVVYRRSTRHRASRPDTTASTSNTVPLIKPDVRYTVAILEMPWDPPTAPKSASEIKKDVLYGNLLNTLEPLKAFRGELQLSCAIGRFLYREVPKSVLLPVSADRCTTAMNDHTEIEDMRTYFTTALTTRLDDVVFLTQLLYPKRPLKGKPLIDEQTMSASAEFLHICEDPVTKDVVQIWQDVSTPASEPRVVGAERTFFEYRGSMPSHVWDYKMQVTGASINNKKWRAFAQELLSKRYLRNDESKSTPDLFIYTDEKEALIKNVQIHRHWRFPFAQHLELSLQITRVEDLASSKRPGEIRFFAKDEAWMVIDGALWYEVRIIASTPATAFEENATLPLGEKASWDAKETVPYKLWKEMHYLARTLVANVDNIGAENKGPKGGEEDRKRKEQKDAAKLEAKRDISFW